MSGLSIGIGIGLKYNRPILGKFNVGEVEHNLPDPIASYRCYDKTNDDTDRDVLKDLTGNGHDIQLYNFGFAESSGYGKYATDFTKWNKRETSNLNLGKNRLEVTGSLQDEWIIYNISFGISQFTINVKGLKEGLEIYYTYSIDGSYKSLRINSDGLYTIPQSDANRNGIGFKVPTMREDYTGLTIEQIPDYKGALVSDGVDDYGLCENFPVFTPEKGFTIIALRSWILRNGFNQVLISDNRDTTIAEYINVNENVISDVYTRVFSSSTLVKNYFKNNGIVVCSSSRYNDLKLTNIGNTPTNSELRIFRAASAALYALEIYDRDLTDEEIAKVKARMIAEYEKKTGNKYEEETV